MLKICHNIQSHQTHDCYCAFIDRSALPPSTLEHSSLGSTLVRTATQRKTSLAVPLSAFVSGEKIDNTRSSSPRHSGALQQHHVRSLVYLCTQDFKKVTVCSRSLCARLLHGCASTTDPTPTRRPTVSLWAVRCRAKPLLAERGRWQRRGSATEMKKAPWHKQFVHHLHRCLSASQSVTESRY